MKVAQVVWVREIAEKVQRKHRLAAEEVEQACMGRNTHIRRARDERYALLGRTEAGRCVFVVFVRLGPGRVLIITARDMTGTERDLYGRHERRL